MRLIHLITIPYLRRHKLRAVLTIIGVVIGVALVVSMRVANRSVAAQRKLVAGDLHTADRLVSQEKAVLI